MTKENKKLYKDYMKKVNQGLKIKFGLKHPAYKDLSDSLTEFLDSETDATAEDVYERFGTPEQAANLLLGKEDLIEMINKQKKLFIWLIPAAILLLGLLILAVMIIGHMYDGYGGTFYVSDAMEVGTPYAE